MQANNPDIHSMDAVLDNLYGAVGSPEREEFRREAYAYMMGQLICDARKQEKLTQSQLAQKVGTDKTYISRIEKGLIEPGISMFCRIIDALGLKIEIVKVMYEVFLQTCISRRDLYVAPFLLALMHKSFYLRSLLAHSLFFLFPLASPKRESSFSDKRAARGKSRS